MNGLQHDTQLKRIDESIKKLWTTNPKPQKMHPGPPLNLGTHQIMYVYPINATYGNSLLMVTLLVPADSVGLLGLSTKESLSPHLISHTSVTSTNPNFGSQRCRINCRFSVSLKLGAKTPSIPLRPSSFSKTHKTLVKSNVRESFFLELPTSSTTSTGVFVCRYVAGP